MATFEKRLRRNSEETDEPQCNKERLSSRRKDGAPQASNFIHIVQLRKERKREEKKIQKSSYYKRYERLRKIHNVKDVTIDALGYRLRILRNRFLYCVGADPIEKVGDASVNTWKTWLGALVAKRHDANLCPNSVLIQHQRTAGIALFNRRKHCYT